MTFSNKRNNTLNGLLRTRIKKKSNIQVYAHSARNDLKFTGLKALLVKGSGHKKGNNGMSTVIEKNQELPAGFIECKNDGCGTKCKLCMSKADLNIAFRRH